MAQPHLYRTGDRVYLPHNTVPPDMKEAPLPGGVYTIAGVSPDYFDLDGEEEEELWYSLIGDAGNWWYPGSQLMPSIAATTPVVPAVPETPDDTEEFDPVKRPAHYNAYPGVEVIDLTKHMNFCSGNVVKYVARAPYKGNALEDLRKAQEYLAYEIERWEQVESAKTA